LAASSRRSYAQRRSSLGRRMSVAAAGLAVLVAVVGIQLAGPGAAEPDPTATPGGTSQATSPTPSVPATSPTASGYLVAGDELRRRAELARDGQEPYRAAVDQLVAAAEQALDDEPRPHNPITYRRGRFLQDARNAYTLALASVVTGDRTYAGHALTIIDAWVERTDSTRHACTTNGGSECATSLLVSRHAPAIVFAADLLESTGALSFESRERLQRWLADVILPAASQRTNSWGDAGTFMRIVVAD